MKIGSALLNCVFSAAAVIFVIHGINGLTGSDLPIHLALICALMYRVAILEIRLNQPR